MLNNELHFMILRCFQNSNLLIMKEAKMIGLLSGQPKVLEYLWENNGAKSIEIANGCALDKSTVASLLVRMEAMGLIKRKVNKKDRRCMNISLTKKGKDKAKEVKTITRNIDELAMKGISDEEKEEFLHTLNQVIKNLREENESNSESL